MLAVWAMTEAMLLKILDEAKARADKSGQRALGDGRKLTIYLAQGGASLTVARVESLSVAGDLVVAQNDKGERYYLPLEAIFAVAAEAAPTTATARKAGFL